MHLCVDAVQKTKVSKYHQIWGLPVVAGIAVGPIGITAQMKFQQVFSPAAS
jgi:hypothetical protein